MMRRAILAAAALSFAAPVFAQTPQPTLPPVVDPPALIHADGWKIAACPHRGGSVAADARGRLYAVWYTEASEGRPDLLFATSADGRRSTAVRRRVIMRTTVDGGRTLSPPQTLTQALKAFAPDVVVAPGGFLVVVWHEEELPLIKTVIHSGTLPEAR